MVSNSGRGWWIVRGGNKEVKGFIIEGYESSDVGATSVT